MSARSGGLQNASQRRGVLDCREYNQRARSPTELCSGRPAYGQDDVPEEAARLIAKADGKRKRL